MERTSSFSPLVSAEQHGRKLPEDERARVLEPPIRLIEQIGKHLLEMSAKQRNDIYTAIEAGAPTQEVIDDVRDSWRYRDTVEPRFEVTVQIVVAQQPPAAEDVESERRGG